MTKGSHRGRWLAAATVCTGLLFGIRGVTRAEAEHGAAVPTVELWIAATPHVDGATSSEVRFVRHGQDLDAEQTWATIHHAPNVPIRGDVLADRQSVVIAFEPEGADPRDDFSTEVHRVDRQGVKRLAGGLYRATRPFVTKTGAVFVERGQAGGASLGLQAKAGELRVDRLTIDELDPETGALRQVVLWSGFTMHLVGEWRDALVVYRVGPHGADVSLIRIDDGSILAGLPIAPFARDFVIAGDHVALSNRDPIVDQRWVLSSIDLKTFAVATLGQAYGQSPIPFVTAQAIIGMSAAPSTMPRSESGVLLLARERGDVPLAMSDDGAFTISLTPGEFDLTEDVHVGSKHRVRLTSRDERVEFIGYRAGTKGALR